MKFNKEYLENIINNNLRIIVKKTIEDYEKNLKIKVTDEIKYEKITDQILNDINGVVEKVFKPDRPPIVNRNNLTNLKIRFRERLFETQKLFPDKILIINSTMMALRKLESYFRENGRGDIADELYKCYMRYQRERYRLYAAPETFGLKKLKFLSGEMWWWISDISSEFSLSVGRISLSSFVIILVFWILFAFSGSINSQLKNDEAALKVQFSDCSSIKYRLAKNDSINFVLNCTKPVNVQLITSDKRATCCECFYYSAVTFLNIGSEVYYPANWWGRFFECCEAVSGWVFLGILLAFFTRRIK